MTMVAFSDLTARWRRSGPVLLALTFFLGTVSGICFSGSAGDAFVRAVYSAAGSSVSCAGLVSAMVLPFLFSGFAAYLKQPILLIPIAFLKAFLFSCLGYSLFTAWGSAGWLITGLIMFGRGCALPVLYWYWLRYIGGREFEFSVFGLILGMLLVIAAVDYYLAVPFLASIIQF